MTNYMFLLPRAKMASSGGGGGGVGCHFSPSGSNAKNKNKSPMLITILFHEVIINKCIMIVFISYTVYNI